MNNMNEAQQKIQDLITTLQNKRAVILSRLQEARVEERTTAEHISELIELRDSLAEPKPLSR